MPVVYELKCLCFLKCFLWSECLGGSAVAKHFRCLFHIKKKCMQTINRLQSHCPLLRSCFIGSCHFAVYCLYLSLYKIYFPSTAHECRNRQSFCFRDNFPARRDMQFYYMASSASGQDEANRALWLATRAGKMEPSCPLGTTRCIPHEKFPRKLYNKSFIDQVYAVKMVGYWPRSFFASLWTSTSSRSINTQKKNLANIQPSWPHTWLITHTYLP